MSLRENVRLVSGSRVVSTPCDGVGGGEAATEAEGHGHGAQHSEEPPRRHGDGLMISGAVGDVSSRTSSQ